MKYKKLSKNEALEQICKRFTGIAESELTELEKQIVEILRKAEYGVQLEKS